MRRVHSGSLVCAAALALLPFTTADVSAQTFKPKFGTGSWTAFGSVHRPQDDIWQAGAGPGGEFWQSTGGFWRPTSGSPIKNPRADTWTQVKAAAKPNKHGTTGAPMHPTTPGGPASTHLGHALRPGSSHAAKTGTGGIPVSSKGLKAGAITMPDGSPIQFKQHGGPVIPSVVVQAVFLGDWKSDSNRQSRRSQLVTAVDTIVTGSYLDALKPFYGVQHGSRDTDVDIPNPFNGTTISDDPGSGNASDLKKLISGWVSNGTLKPAASNRLYIMFLAPELSATPWANQGGFGYHSSINSQSPPIIYAVINTSSSFLPTSTASHEIAEAATDPTGGGWYVDKTVGSPGQQYNPEIGDFTDGATIDGKTYQFFGATLNGVFVQLLLDPNGNIIQVPGATPSLRKLVGSGRGGMHANALKLHAAKKPAHTLHKARPH